MIDYENILGEERFHQPNDINSNVLSNRGSECFVAVSIFTVTYSIHVKLTLNKRSYIFPVDNELASLPPALIALPLILLCNCFVYKPKINLDY